MFWVRCYHLLPSDHILHGKICSGKYSHGGWVHLPNPNILCLMVACLMVTSHGDDLGMGYGCFNHFYKMWLLLLYHIIPIPPKKRGTHNPRHLGTSSRAWSICFLRPSALTAAAIRQTSWKPRGVFEQPAPIHGLGSRLHPNILGKLYYCHVPNHQVKNHHELPFNYWFNPIYLGRL